MVPLDKAMSSSYNMLPLVNTILNAKLLPADINHVHQISVLYCSTNCSV